jgi:hypothetical protein
MYSRRIMRRRKPMALKELFLSYVERQRNANSIKEAFGTDDPRTIDAYQDANEYKRRVLTLIEEIENDYT